MDPSLETRTEFTQIGCRAAFNILVFYACIVILQTYKNFTAVELLLTDPSLVEVGLRVGKLTGSAFITGWILDVVLLVLIVGSLTFVRRSGPL